MQKLKFAERLYQLLDSQAREEWACRGGTPRLRRLQAELGRLRAILLAFD